LGCRTNGLPFVSSSSYFARLTSVVEVDEFIFLKNSELIAEAEVHLAGTY
jgi:hypothetical protein